MLSSNNLTTLIKRNILTGLLLILLGTTAVGLGVLTIFAISPSLKNSEYEKEIKIEGGDVMGVRTEKYFDYQGKKGLIIRMDQNTLIAFDSACTHEGVMVNYDREKNLIWCPAHGAVFQPWNGVPIAGPTNIPLRQIILDTDYQGTGEVWAVGWADSDEYQPFLPLLLAILGVPSIPVIWNLWKRRF